jgi:hypothetical protein
MGRHHHHLFLTDYILRSLDVICGEKASAASCRRQYFDPKLRGTRAGERESFIELRKIVHLEFGYRFGEMKEYPLMCSCNLTSCYISSEAVSL